MPPRVRRPSVAQVSTAIATILFAPLFAIPLAMYAVHRLWLLLRRKKWHSAGRPRPWVLDETYAYMDAQRERLTPQQRRMQWIVPAIIIPLEAIVFFLLYRHVS